LFGSLRPHMIDLFEELKKLIGALEEQQIDYALCGGLAVAIYTLPRATVDIDLVIQPESLNSVKSLAKTLGYLFEAAPMEFAAGAVRIVRMTRIDHPRSDDTLMLDLLLVTPETADVWESRERLPWEGGTLTVVSRSGLIKLKSLRSSPQDLMDIENLRG
jgi:hypothetical protein